MLIVTTPTIPGREPKKIIGLVTGEVVIGVHIFRDIFAFFRDIFGGRTRGYEDAVHEAREAALAELEKNAAAMGANAIIGVDFDYETMGRGTMLMISATGTAVQI